MSKRRPTLFNSPAPGAAPGRAAGSPRCLVLTALVALAPVLRATPVSLVPAPHQVKWSPEAPLVLAPGRVAIVLGAHATAPEQHAARMLDEYVARRFHQQWPVVREGAPTPAGATLFVLGQRDTSQTVDRLCRDHAINLDRDHPGHDGYVISIVRDHGATDVLVGGSNARAVIYGQDTLTQLLQAESGSLRLVRAEIRDAPVIPWRGRPQTSVAEYLRPGELDLYARARMNFIDLRSGVYAFQPGEHIDHAEVSEVIRKAHNRGMLVYGTVNCGVPKAEYPAVLGSFREMLGLGVDGLWISFDDKGPGGDPVWLVRHVLALGRQHGITGHLIATTPPKGSYPKIITAFNRKIMAIPGMPEAMWFWTAVPSQETLAQARSIGLKTQLSWWHNWPRIFTSQRYVGIPPLSLGWSEPQYAALAHAGKVLDYVMPWGGNSLGRYYVAPVIGWWAWNPPAHDWNALRRRICDLVFGTQLADAGVAFDDGFKQLAGMYVYSYKDTPEHPYCPPRLQAPGERAAALGLVRRVQALLDRITANAPAESFLPRAELETQYLQPMRREFDGLARAATLSFPEDWYPNCQRKILSAVETGHTAAAESLMADARPRIVREVAAIAQAFPDFPHIAGYAAWWRTRAELDVAGWRKLLAAKAAEIPARVADDARNRNAHPATMLAGLATPPLEWGIGRWQVSNRLLATALPDAQPRFWGDWDAGLYGSGKTAAAVFVSLKKKPGEPGEYAELPVTVPTAGVHDHLAILLFASSANKDLFSNTPVPYRWAGYRYIQLRWGDKVLWEQDLGWIPNGGQWFLVPVPPLPRNLTELPLTLRVEDRQVSMNNYTLTFVSPLRLLEMPH